MPYPLTATGNLHAKPCVINVTRGNNFWQQISGARLVANNGADSGNITIAYAARTDFKQRYYANDHSKDTVVVEQRPMRALNGRTHSLSLNQEGFILTDAPTEVSDFRDSAEVARIYPEETAALLRSAIDADSVQITAPAILRFSEKSGLAGSSDNSHPARFAHVDITDTTAAEFAEQTPHEGRKIARYAHYNIWRCFSGAPQDVGLALCDAGSVIPDDLLTADAIFDPPGDAPQWQFESWLLAHNANHRWHIFPDMARDEAIIFKTSDSAYANPAPHVAFDNPLAGPDAPPRASVEMRAIALWFA